MKVIKFCIIYALSAHILQFIYITDHIYYSSYILHFIYITVHINTVHILYSYIILHTCHSFKRQNILLSKIVLSIVSVQGWHPIFMLSLYLYIFIFIFAYISFRWQTWNVSLVSLRMDKIIHSFPQKTRWININAELCIKTMPEKQAGIRRTLSLVASHLKATKMVPVSRR